MPFKITEEGVKIRESVVPFGTFGNLVERHLLTYRGTATLERQAAELMAAAFPEVDLEQFIRKVCRWGGYAGIGARVIKDNQLHSIRAHFLAAIGHLVAAPPRLADALHEINLIRGLGTPSFASKHMRFLRPDICPILDDINRQALQYAFTPEGYAELSGDCLYIAAKLLDRRIANPMNRANGRWFAADVEMATFAHLKNM